MPENPTWDVDLRRYVKKLLYRTTVAAAAVVLLKKKGIRNLELFVLILFFFCFFPALVLRE